MSNIAILTTAFVGIYIEKYFEKMTSKKIHV